MRPENQSPPVDDSQPNAAVQAAADVDVQPVAKANVAVQPVAAPGTSTVPIVDRIDPYKKCTRNRRVVSSQYFIEPDAELVSLPDIRSVPEEELDVLQKLVQCQKIFDFSDPLRKRWANRFTYEISRFNGISELLEILESIINGFSVHLKKEHKTFLKRVLLPLHTPRGLSLYHTQLTCCVVQFVQKEKSLIPVVFDYLFKHWPRSSISKEMLFLAEIDELLESVDMAQFGAIAEPLCRQLCKSIGNGAFRVTERVLGFWGQERFVSMVDRFAEDVFPIIMSVLMRILEFHWNPNTRALVTGVMRILERNNAELLEEHKVEYELMSSDEEDATAEREDFWRKIERLALKHQEKEKEESATTN